jgi:hypothetical protein
MTKPYSRRDFLGVALAAGPLPVLPLPLQVAFLAPKAAGFLGMSDKTFHHHPDFMRRAVDAGSGFFCSAGFGHLGVHLRKSFRRRDMRHRYLKFIFRPTYDTTIASHHGFPAVLRDVGWIVLAIVSAHFGIQHAGAFEEAGVSRARH